MSSVRSRGLVAVAYLLLLAIAGWITLQIVPHRPMGITLTLTLGMTGLVAGFLLARYVQPARWVIPLTVLALLTTLLLWTPLGVKQLGAYRHVDLGISIEPSGLWVLSCHVATAAALTGLVSKRWMFINYLGALVAALTMPELSLIPQVAVGSMVIAWLCGQRRWVIVPVVLAVVVIAASFLFPYVQNRWTGFFDPAAYAQGAGYDYRGLARILADSEWFAGMTSTMPRVSSPADDYWFTVGIGRMGIFPMMAWALGVVTLLWRTHVLDRKRKNAQSLLLSAVSATMLICLVIHAGYNLGIWPITATYAPLAGLSGSIIGAHLAGIGLGLGRLRQ